MKSTNTVQQTSISNPSKKQKEKMSKSVLGQRARKSFISALSVTVLCVGFINVKATPIWTEDFSDQTGFKPDPSFGTDNDEDYWTITDGSGIDKDYVGTNGNFLAGQDLDDDDAAGQKVVSATWTDIDISSKTDIEFTGEFAEKLDGSGDIDKKDYLKIEYQIDSGEYQNLLAFENDGEKYNTKFWEDTDFDGVASTDDTCISSSEGTLISFTKSISGTGSSLNLKLSAYVDSGDEDFAADNFSLTAVPEPGTLILLFFGAISILWFRIGRKA